MFCIGLTGTIGSGKSTAAGFFKDLGIFIVNADAISKDLSRMGAPAYFPIVGLFGEEALQVDGELNRKFIRERIFQDPNLRQALEGLLHPMIRKGILTAIEKSKSAYTIIEIPLLTDKSHYPYLDRVLLVQMDKALQIQRVITRDKISPSQALDILNFQANAETLQRLADDRIINDGSLEALQLQVKKLHIQYLILSKKIN